MSAEDFCRKGTYTTGSKVWPVSSFWTIFDATPTTVRHASAVFPSNNRSRFPSGFSPGQILARESLIHDRDRNSGSVRRNR